MWVETATLSAKLCGKGVNFCRTPDSELVLLSEATLHSHVEHRGGGMRLTSVLSADRGRCLKGLMPPILCVRSRRLGWDQAEAALEAQRGEDGAGGRAIQFTGLGAVGLCALQVLLQPTAL